MDGTEIGAMTKVHSTMYLPISPSLYNIVVCFIKLLTVYFIPSPYLLYVMQYWGNDHAAAMYGSQGGFGDYYNTTQHGACMHATMEIFLLSNHYVLLLQCVCMYAS